MKASRTRKHVIIIISCAAAPFLADLDPVSSFQFQSPLSPPSPSRIRHGPFRPLRHHIHLQPPSFDDDGIHRQYRGESPSILNEREAPPEDMSRRVFFMKSLAALAVATTAAMTTTSEDVAEAAADVAAVESAAASLTPSVSEGELTISNPPPNRARVVDIDEDTTINDPLQSSTSTAVESEAITTDATTAIVDATTTSRVKNKPSSDPRYFLAGGLSAAISHGITTPIDVVKTRMQSDSSLSSLSPQTAALQIYQRDGPSALAAGLGPTVLGYGVEGALKFGVYESLKPALLSLLAPSAGDPTQPYLVAAVCAGALASIVLCPMEETRIRLVTDPEFGAEGLWDGLPALLGEEGPLMPFRRGMLPMLSKQVPYTVGKQVSFDVFAGMLYGWLAALGVLTTEGGPMGMIPQQEVALGVEIGAAFLASLVACLASHPGDVLLTATYKNGKNGKENDGYGNAGDADANNENTGFGATISTVYQEGGGIAAFFRGLNARFFHVGCIITFQLVIYDQMKQFLGLPASGAH